MCFKNKSWLPANGAVRVPVLLISAICKRVRAPKEFLVEPRVMSKATCFSLNVGLYVALSFSGRQNVYCLEQDGIYVTEFLT